MSFFDYNKYDCEDFGPSLEEFEHARDHLLGLLDDIYKSGNINDLEFHLEELCIYFGAKIPQEDPKVEKKVSKEEKHTKRMLQNWVGYTRAYAEMMSGSTRKEITK